MKLVDAVTWVPEDGALSVGDGLATLPRFTRTAAAVVDRLAAPMRHPVVLATSSEAPEPAIIHAALSKRYPEVPTWSFVRADAETLAASLLQAQFLCARAGAAVWVLVDLKPAAELAAAAYVRSDTQGRQLQLLRTADPADPSLPHLNSCAGVLTLLDDSSADCVSIRVGRWAITVRSRSV